MERNCDPQHNTSGLSWGRVHYRFGDVGLESDVAHAFSVLCRRSRRHPTAQRKGWRANETRRQDDQKVFSGTAYGR